MPLPAVQTQRRVNVAYKGLASPPCTACQATVCDDGPAFNRMNDGYLNKFMDGRFPTDRAPYSAEFNLEPLRRLAGRKFRQRTPATTLRCR